MFGAVVIAAGVFGVLWGKNHPEKPFEDMYNAVNSKLTGWLGKNKQKEKSDDKKEDK